MSELQRDPLVCVIAGSPGDEWAEAAAAALDPAVPCRLAGPAASGFASACVEGGDVLVVLGPCELDAGVAAGLRAHAAPDVATVSALPLTAGLTLEAVRAALDGATPATPALDGPAGPVVLLTRAAMDLVGGPAADAADAAAAVAGFGERCARRGLAHVLADTVPVVDPAATPGPPGIEHGRARVRRRSGGLTVTIDARALNGGPAGTQVHLLELIGALAGRCALRVVLPRDPSPWAAEALTRVEGVELRSYDEVIADPRPTDVVHRPHQVYDLHDVALLRRLGSRLVVTHQDQLLFRNPAYFRAHDEWLTYRRLSRLVYAWAARVVFFTRAARDEALRDGIVEAGQAAVVPIGADRRLTVPGTPPARPKGDWGALGDRPFLLVLGSDLVHKNRPFAVRLLAELRGAGWDGGLVLAGPALDHGSTGAEESAIESAAALPVVRLGSVSEPERGWLLEACAAVAFPSLDEGFGLVPFEAGAADRPCLFAPIGPLAELFGEASTLVPWDPARSARSVLPLLTDGPERDSHVAALRAAAAPLTWDAAVEGLLALYEAAADAPDRPVRTLTADADEREEQLADLWDEVGELGLALIGRTGTIPFALRQPLLTLTGHRVTRAPLFVALRLIARLRRQA